MIASFIWAVIVFRVVNRDTSWVRKNRFQHLVRTVQSSVERKIVQLLLSVPIKKTDENKTIKANIDKTAIT